jgi:hypothetical protein
MRALCSKQQTNQYADTRTSMTVVISVAAWKFSNWKNGKIPENFQKEFFHFGNFQNGNILVEDPGLNP